MSRSKRPIHSWRETSSDQCDPPAFLRPRNPRNDTKLKKEKYVGENPPQTFSCVFVVLVANFNSHETHETTRNEKKELIGVDWGQPVFFIDTPYNGWSQSVQNSQGIRSRESGPICRSHDSICSSSKFCTNGPYFFTSFILSAPRFKIFRPLWSGFPRFTSLFFLAINNSKSTPNPYPVRLFWGRI